MFWGLVLKANKRYSQTVTKTFHLSQATLDVANSTSDADVQVMLASDNQNYILCTLNKNKILQVPLDLVFSEGDDISFSCVGGVVHLTGYLVPSDEDMMGLGDDSDSDEEVNTVEIPSKKNKQNDKNASKQQVIAEQGEDEEDDDEDDSDFDGMNGAAEVSDDEGLNDSSEDDDDDDDEDEEEEDAESDEEPQTKKLKHSGIENGTAKPAQKEKKKDKPQQQQEKPTQQKQQKPKEKTLQGGIKIEDIRVGKGPEAKPGKKVVVYYEGRLKSNNKVFDSTKSGAGFEFNLGRGEVIRGWDVGVAGMKVGSKRRIVCPPHMAYGAKGSPPVIPGNSTLVFEVELRGVK